MNHNLNYLRISCKHAVFYEILRKKLVDRSLYNSAYRTYFTQNWFLPDQNSEVFWDKKFENAVINHPLENWRNKKVARKIKGGQKILNLGVGSGKLENILHHRNDIEYIGTDITSKTLESLKKKFKKFVFLNSPLFPTPFSNQTFDTILLLEVLEHIRPYETFRVLREIHRVLKRNGILILSVPVNEGLERMLPKNPNSHQRLYSEKLVEFELRKAGFFVVSVEKASAFPSFFFLKHILNRLFILRAPNNLIFTCQKK